MVGIAVGIVLLPELSRRLQAKDDIGARTAFSRAGEITLALSLPAAVALCVIPLPLVSALFEHGATGRSAAEAMALATAIYGLGLPAFVLQKLLQPVYFAREDTKTPFRYAVVSMIVNAALAVGLMPAVGWVAPAIATTVSAWILVALLMLGTRRYGAVAQFDHRFKARLPRIAIAALAMGAVLWAAASALDPWVTSTLQRIGFAAFLVVAGVIAYGICGRITGAFSGAELRGALRRSR